MNTQGFFQILKPWLVSSGVKIVFILIAALIIHWFFKAFIGKIVKRVTGEKRGEAENKRAKTLISVFQGTANFIIGIVAILMILPEFGVNIGALLTGVGLLGLAVGMASKEIISDFLSGFFILLENQFQVGDKVKIAGIEGEVKEITLRRTIIKDEKGLLHAIPNSQIKVVAKKE
jgi:small conductance mechanosensitive channel